MSAGAEPAVTAEASGVDVKHRRLDRTAGLVIALIGLVFTVLSVKIGVWRETGPGGGLLPMLAAVSMVVAAAMVVARPSAADIEASTEVELRRVSIGIALAALYAALFIGMGYLFASFVVTVAWLRILAEERWRSALLIALCAAAAIHLIFAVALGLPLPRDWFL